jgi:arylsulfatase A-like enzyme
MRMRGWCALALATLGACGAERGERPDVVLVTLDTTRADRLSCYGYGRETSPRLDALARDGVRHAHARATSSWTLPTHASLFTGRFTASHGACYDPEGPVRLGQAVEGFDHYRARPLVEAETTLAERLAQRGWRTAGFVAGPWLARPFGLAQGFEHWDDTQIDSVRGRLAEQVTDAALAWVGALAQGEPCFLFLNYYDPHGPYGAPPPFTLQFVEGAPPAVDGQYPQAYLRELKARESEVLGDLYDGEIRYADHHLGRLFDGLAQLGRFEDALIVVTADHGEWLGENGLWGHGEDLGEAELAIPLVVRPPGGVPGGAVSELAVQQTDVVPIVLDVLGLPLPPEVQGHLPRAADAPSFAELHGLPGHRREGLWRTLVHGERKLLWSESGARELYDLSADPLGLADRAAADPAAVESLSTLLEAWARTLPPPGAAPDSVELDEATLRALESLGYVR